ncbi:MAG: hypothetical protein ABIP78_12895 [Pyrinomonadaceae bacterium]
MTGIAYDAMKRPGAVEMLYDGNRRIIGLSPTDPRKRNAFAVKKHGTAGSYRWISAAAFCSHFRLKFARTLLFDQGDIDDDGVMPLDLGKVIAIGRDLPTAYRLPTTDY